jgi:hypothetical protein
MHSVRHFLGEAVEVLTHADSSVWGTLHPLLTRPGFLTREYFAGRRARYLQPFRLYVVLSVLFLLLAGLLSEGGEPVQVTGQSTPGSSCALRYDGMGAAWLLPRLDAACHKVMSDNGHALSQGIVHNLGRAMFIFLPLLAAFMKLLYWRPRRYYMEHLLLLFHNHAFVFLWLSVYLLAGRWLPANGLQGLLDLGMSAYLAHYLYRSMRVMYGQSGFLTILKFSVLALAYFICAIVTLMATALVSAVTL